MEGTGGWCRIRRGWGGCRAGAGGLLFLGLLLMILFRQEYPRWWFDWNLETAALHQPGVDLDLVLLNAATLLGRPAGPLDYPYPDAAN